MSVVIQQLKWPGVAQRMIAFGLDYGPWARSHFFHFNNGSQLNSDLFRSVDNTALEYFRYFDWSGWPAVLDLARLAF